MYSVLAGQVMEGVEASAISLLKRAVELDTGGQRLDEASTLYQEGVSLLLSVMKGMSVNSFALFTFKL